MTAFLILVIGLLTLQNTASQKSVSKSSGPPAFFLQDPNDGLCLAGEKYKRCAIDTLWYVTGKPGSYQIHHRKVDETEDDVCLDKCVNYSIISKALFLSPIERTAISINLRLAYPIVNIAAPRNGISLVIPIQA